MNPCTCGYHGDTQKPCTCAPALVTKYQKRISGALLDRIHIHIEVPRVDYEKLSGNRAGESSELIRARVQQATRDIPSRCYSNNDSSDIVCNADMRVRGDPSVLQVAIRGAQPDEGSDESTQFVGAGLASHPQMARTIADLAGSDEIQSVHLTEALQYHTKLILRC